MAVPCPIEVDARRPRLNPAGRLVLPPKVTRADDHADGCLPHRAPAPGRHARPWYTPIVAGSLKLQGADVAWPTASPSTW